MNFSMLALSRCDFATIVPNLLTLASFLYHRPWAIFDVVYNVFFRGRFGRLSFLVL